MNDEAFNRTAPATPGLLIKKDIIRKSSINIRAFVLCWRYQKGQAGGGGESTISPC